MTNKNHTIKKIVLTGGPCAGKTTIFQEIKHHLTNKGYYVITVTETAEQLIKNKIVPKNEKEHTLMFQDIVLQMQYQKELIAKIYAQKISKEKDVIILYDRGINDNRAYLDSNEEYDDILNKYNLNELEILDNYDLVLDLLSTASTNKELYSLNGIRTETPDEAEQLDKKTSLAWLHHKNIKTIKPTKEIKTKSAYIINLIDDFLNNYQEEFNIIPLDYNSDLSIYNDNNSKTINIQTFYLDNNITLTKKDYRNYSILKYQSNIEEKNITKEEFINILSTNQIIYTDHKKEIIFIENSNIYKIIFQNNNLYLEYNKDNELSLPNNLIPLNTKPLVKTKKYDNI